jgi:hypothetical protein
MPFWRFAISRLQETIHRNYSKLSLFCLVFCRHFRTTPKPASRAAVWALAGDDKRFSRFLPHLIAGGTPAAM